MKITCELLNGGVVQGQFERITETAQHGMKDFWREIGHYMVKQTVKERFDKQQAPDGTPWKAWSAKYADRVNKGKRPHKILKDRGELRRIQSEAHDDHVLIGSKLKYAATHQFGDSRRNIPARPYLGITDSEQDEIKRRMQQFIRRCLLE